MKKHRRDNKHPDSGPTADEGGSEQSRPEEGADDPTAELRAELEELRTRYQRTLADYRNSQQRAALEQRLARESGIACVVERLLSILDHFDLALGHSGGVAGAEQVVQGVRMIRDELHQMIQSLGVIPIRPQANDEFDPQRHQAVSHQPRAGVGPGRVAETFQIGYTLGDRLLRPAKVAVSPDENAQQHGDAHADVSDAHEG